MEFALVLRELSKRWLLLVVGVLVAAVAAIFSVYRLEGTQLKARSLQYSSASTQVLVDTPSSVLGNLSRSFEPLNTRAAVYANFMASPAVLKLIGQQAGLSGEQIYAAGPVNANEPRVVQEPTALKRNVEITGETNPYRLSFESQANLPTITINSQAPTTEQAVTLANAAAVGLQRYVTSLENADRIPAQSRVTIRQLGSAHGAVVNGGISKALATIVFVAVFLLWCVLVLAATRFRKNWRASAALEGAWDDESGDAKRSEGGVDAGEAAMLRSDADASEIPPLDTSDPVDDRTVVPTRSAQ
jgi:capsular polysaccharide biosynthesis protein